MYTEDTICAIATAPGGAIGVIRVSGPLTFQLLPTVFVPAGKKPLSQRVSHTAVFGHIMHGDEVVDEVLVTLFRGPHSYTGEDSAEISCHGSQYILQRVLQLLMGAGCRMANPGEYTQRAFLNGRMDLSQAEAVADLIASSSAASHRLAMSQMRGEFSQELRLLREKLLHITSLLELELDFGDHEELEFANRTELMQLTKKIRTTISRLVNSFHTGNSLKNGVPVAIIGPTNAGKSTLLNALLHEERAIVSSIQGTTRDTIEDTVTLGGILFRFIDTAGIRQTDDEIENLGINRSYQMIERADIVLLITAPDNNLDKTEIQKITNLCKSKTLIHLLNKSDLYTQPVEGALAISAKQGTGISQLENLLVSTMQSRMDDNHILITNARHEQALRRGLTYLDAVAEGLAANLPGDLVSMDLRAAIHALAEVTGGEIQDTDILANIFKNFCIGK